MNLLSPTEKTFLRHLRMFQVAKQVAALVVSLALVTGTVLGFAYLLLQNNSASLEQQIAAEQSIRTQGRGGSIGEATIELNKQLVRAADVVAGHVSWVPFLASISSAVPEQVTLTNLQVNTSASSFRIAGQSKNRDSLLTFQNNLSQLKSLSNITAPLANLIQKENITFEITGTLTKALYE